MASRHALLIRPYGPMGAAVATVIASLVRFVVLYGFSQRLWPVSYQWRAQLTLVGIGSVATGAAFLVSVGGVVARTAYGVGLLAAYLVAVWFAVLAKEDRALLSGLVRSSPRALLARLARA